VNHVLTRMIDKYGETIAALRAKLAHALPDHANAYRAEYVTVSVPAPDVARAADQLAEAARNIQQGIERERKQSERITRLESSTGALMVDRDRGIRQAETRTAGARLVAADALAALREAGIEPGADLDTLAADAVRHYDTTLDRLDAEVRRLDEFRCSIVGLIQQCQDQSRAGKGLTAEQVSKLGRRIERANQKACGR
jgi:hypothetical protein